MHMLTIKDEIKELVNKLFCDIAYSRRTDEAKKKIAEAYEKRFIELCVDSNDIEALGKLMAEYGTLEKAAILAGYSEDEIQCWKDEKNPIGSKALAGYLRKVRWQIYALSLSIVFASISILQLLLLEVSRYLIILGLALILAIIFARLLSKNKEITYLNSSFDKEGNQYLEKISDCYGKQMLNSIYIAIG